MEETEQAIKEIMIDLRFPYDEAVINKINSFIKQHLTEHEYDLFYKYFTARTVYEMLSREDSPVVEAMNSAIDLLIYDADVLISMHTENSILQKAQIEQQKRELKDLNAKLTEANSKIEVLRSTLIRLRKLLKADEVKEALSFCDKLRKQNVVGEIGQKAVLLGDSIKNALVAIKGV